MKKNLVLFITLTLLCLYIGFRVKSEFFYAPYPNLIEYVLSVFLLLTTLITLIWKKHRRQKLVLSLCSIFLLFGGINIMNYRQEWHPLHLSLPFSQSQSAEADFEPYAWDVESPEENGYDAHQLETYLRKVDGWKRLRGLLIVKNDKLVVEKYFAGATKYSLFNVHSMTKSVTSALVGLAIQQGKIKSEDDLVMPYFPEYAGIAKGSRKDSLTLKHLLTMRGGFVGGDGYQSVEQCLVEEKIGADFGNQFKYFTGSQQILSAVVTKAVGQPTKNYADQQFFKPLGIRNGFWRKIDGYYCGGGESYYTARDLARFGSLYLNNGKVGEVQLLDSVWVAKSFANYTPQSKYFRSLTSYQEYGYGYCWWLLKDQKHSTIYAARGKGGQHILLLPDKKTVVVILQEWNLEKDVETEEKFIHELLALL